LFFTKSSGQKFRMKSCNTLLVSGQSKNKCKKVSSGQGFLFFNEQNVHCLLTSLLKCDTLVLIPKMLLRNLKENSLSLFGKKSRLHIL
jgi:hypothetical protein